MKALVLDADTIAAYRAGEGFNPIARRIGASAPRVRAALVAAGVEIRPVGSHGYRAPPVEVVVPGWVPPELRAPYADLASLEGEEAAASYARRAKANMGAA